MKSVSASLEEKEMANAMNIQWYPGHMTKAKRQMEEDIKLVDLIIELVDARIPLASRNPDIDILGRSKLRLILLNKSDLADAAVSRQWMDYFQNMGASVVCLDARNQAGMKQIREEITRLTAAKAERNRKRGILNRPVRAMVAGIPNVGKSTFINSFARRACTKTGNKPGVTRGNQWIRLSKDVELLDTPGILWPRIGDPVVSERLSMIGTINDDIINLEELTLHLIRFLQNNYPGALAGRYAVEETESEPVVLGAIAAARGCLQKGAAPDYSKASRLVLDDFRSGRIGRFTLERPNA